MRISLWLLCGALFATNLFGSIIYQVNSLGGNNYSYTYTFTGMTFQQNQDVEIAFDPALYGNLSNATAGAGFAAPILFQPNNPPGATGQYVTYSLMAISVPTGTFSVQFTFNGAGQPGAQPFSMYQLDETGGILSQLASGWTIAQGTGQGTATPEPASFGLGAAAILAGGGIRYLRRRRVVARAALQ